MPPYRLTDPYGLIIGSPEISRTLIGDEIVIFSIYCRLTRYEISNPKEIMLQCQCGHHAYLVFEDELHCDLSYDNGLTIFFR